MPNYAIDIESRASSITTLMITAESRQQAIELALKDIAPHNFSPAKINYYVMSAEETDEVPKED